MPIIIYAYSFDMGVGGNKVLHKLCHLLNTMGHESYLYSTDPNFKTYYKNTPLITEAIENCVVVYAEVEKGNPLNCKNVVRWQLGPVRMDTAMTFAKSDLVFWHDRFYYDDFLGQKDNLLNVVEYHDDIFVNKNYKRHGSCYTIRKANPETYIHPSDSICIPYDSDFTGDLEAMSELFNKTEKFYSYDARTFLSVQAAMCGCISVVVPNSRIPREKWLNGGELSKYGIAYGEDDIERATNTLPLLYAAIKNTDIETKKQIESFVEKCNETFNNTPC